MLCILGFFTNYMECEGDKQYFSNKVIVLNATSVLILQKKVAGKRVSRNIIQLVYFNYYNGKPAKEMADMYVLLENQNSI